jgi:hypothetical protein
MRGILSLIFILLFEASSAQKNINYFGIEPIVGYHFAPNKIEKTGASLNGISSGFDVKYFFNKKRPSNFNLQYSNPDFSLNARFCKLNNTDTFGYSLAIFPQIELPIFKSKNFCFNAKMGYGINFNSKKYDSITNFDNRAISSIVNFALDAGFSAQYRLNKSNELGIGTGLYHVSNGSLKMFNGGLNIVYGSLSYRHFIESYLDSKYEKSVSKTFIKNKGLNYQIYTAIAHREFGYFSQTKSFWISSVSQQITKRINHIYQLGISIDVIYDATPALLQNDNIQLSEISFQDKVNFGIGFYHQFDVARFYFPFSASVYLKELKNPYYIRFGLGYYLNNHFFIGGFFKGSIKDGSKLDSDFIEWSIGYRLRK